MNVGRDQAVTTTPVEAPEDDHRGPATRRLQLFGPMRVESAGRTTAVPRGDAQRLLGYIALHQNSAHRREVLTETLWPDATDRSRRSLSDTLYRLRRQLGDGWLEVDIDTVALRRGVDVDVREFDRLAAGSEPADVAAAVAAYGELVPGLYDDWALEHRAARHAAYVAALGRSATAQEEAGDLERAVLDARQLILAEPLDEPAHQRYLRLLGRLHRYGDAIAHFEVLKALLADELGVGPLQATVEIVDRLTAERAVAAAAVGGAEQRSRFVGRVTERAAALSAVEAMLDGRGSVLCVEGVAGIGKSRLLDEVLAGARWRGATVTLSDVHEIPEASPLAPLARALTPLLSVPVRMEIESRLDKLTMLALAPLHPDWQPVGEVAVHDEKGRLQNGLQVVGEVIATSGNVLVALDDLHWASASLWDHVAAFIDGFVPRGGLFVGCYRRPEIESTTGWPVLQGWDRRGMTNVLRLLPFEPEDVAALLGSSSADVHAVLAATGGVPFYITEWLLGTDREPGLDSTTMARRRLELLAPTHRRALECGAVLGETMTFRAWRDVTEMPPMELAAAGDRLTADRWLATTDAGHVFTHDLLRRAVYEQIAATDRTALHERAAAVLGRLDPDNWRTRAFHLDRAGLTIEAAAAYRAAGRALRAEFAFADALDAFGRALELVPRRRRRQRLELGLEFAEVYDIVRGRPEASEILTEITATARRIGDDRSLLRGLLLAGLAPAAAGDKDGARHLLAEARSLAERLGDRRSVADAMFRQANLLTGSGHWPEGYQQFLDALDLIDRQEDPWLYGRTLCGAAGAAARMGRSKEAAGWLEDALAGYRATGDRLNEMDVLSYLMMTHIEHGSWDQLVSTAEQTLALARSFGHLTVIGIACQGLALAALAVGDRTTARAMLTETTECWNAADRRAMVASAINCRGLAECDDGNFEEAIALFREAIEAARAVDAVTNEVYASHDLGALLVELGRSEEAAPLLRASARHWADAGNHMLQAKSEAYLGLALLDTGVQGEEPGVLADAGLALFRSGVVLGEHPQAWLWGLSRLLGRLGRRSEADDVLDAARRELIRQSATIADPERRRGYFEMVPLNRAIMADADERSGTARAAVVRLAHVDAPLGRTLRPDELVEVRWTMHAPDDEALEDPAERRRHRLRRLLEEAARRDAAPTDDDLAAALGVSRRTILRDMDVLGASVASSTRRRGRGVETGVP